MGNSREEHWRDVAEDGKDKNNIYALGWYFYTIEKEQLIKRLFLFSVPHRKGSNILWNCVKDNIIEEKEQQKYIRLRGFGYKLFEEEEGGGIRELLYSYLYLMHLINLCLGYQVKYISKTNEAVGMNNRLDNYGGNKRLVHPLVRKIFWKCIGCILLIVTYVKKFPKLCSEIPKIFGNKSTTKLQRDVCGTTYLNKVCCDLFLTYYCYACN